MCRVCFLSAFEAHKQTKQKKNRKKWLLDATWSVCEINLMKMRGKRVLGKTLKDLNKRHVTAFVCLLRSIRACICSIHWFNCIEDQQLYGKRFNFYSQWWWWRNGRELWPKQYLQCWIKQNTRVSKYLAVGFYVSFVALVEIPWQK